jgi:hypothetical protein
MGGSAGGRHESSALCRMLFTTHTWLQVICTLAPTVKVLHLRVNAPNPGSWQALSQLVWLEDLQIAGTRGYGDWVHRSRSYSVW